MANPGTGNIDTTSGGAEGDRLQEAASGLVDQAARTAEAQASTTMTRAGDTLEQVARAIRDAGSGMRDEQPQIAGIADTAARRVEEASHYLRDHEAGEVVDNLQSWARQQPAMVIGGGLAIGLLLGRFLKSGSSSPGGGWQAGNGRSGLAGSGQPYAGTGYGGDAGSGYGTSPSGYPGAAALGSTGYETSSAGYAGGTGYDAGTLAGDPLGTGSSTGAGSLGGVSTASTLDHASGGYATGTSETGDVAELGADDVGDQLAATDAAAETSDASGTRPKRRRR